MINWTHDLAGLSTLAWEIKLKSLPRDKGYIPELEDYVAAEKVWEVMAAREDPPPDYVPTFLSNPFSLNRKRPEGITYHLAGNHGLRLFNPWESNKRINSTVGGELSVSDARSILRTNTSGFSAPASHGVGGTAPWKSTRSGRGTHAHLHNHDGRARHDGTPGSCILQSPR